MTNPFKPVVTKIVHNYYDYDGNLQAVQKHGLWGEESLARIVIQSDSTLVAWLTVVRAYLVNQSNLCIVWLCWDISFRFLCLYLILEAVERWMAFSFGNCVFSCFWSDREWGKSYVVYLLFLYSGKLGWSSQHLDLFCLLFRPGPVLKFLLPLLFLLMKSQ